ncbi:MAG: hypothetical protein PHS46_07395 [Candidatus Omnitrophica bacterium]|nr:hypothetical protein [Candidatus Omnitrophota bacterium]
MGKNFKYCNYIVAFIDVLGQKDAFNGISDIPENKEQEHKLNQAHSQTVLFVEKLRGYFYNFFNSYSAYAEEGLIKVIIPEEKKEQFKEMRKCILKHVRFSDCIQAFVPLESVKYHAPCAKGVVGVLGACGMSMLFSLSEGKSFRAGIDVGIGTELSSGEVYGPGFFSAYRLESEIAQYPRIVIGDTMVNYLANLCHSITQLPNQTIEDIQVCKALAGMCEKMMTTDLDGRYILDYLGAGFRDIFYSNLSAEEKKEMADLFKCAFTFVENEYKKQKANRGKLAIRYYMLYNYFKARVKLWEK